MVELCLDRLWASAGAFEREGKRRWLGCFLGLLSGSVQKNCTFFALGL